MATGGMRAYAKPKKLSDKLEPLGEKEHVAAKKPRKSRAKKTGTKRTVYKTPGASNGVREGLLGSASGPVLTASLMPIMPWEAEAIGLAAGRRLGIIADKYDPATRKQRPYIVRP